jgi:hypothetical protein
MLGLGREMVQRCDGAQQMVVQGDGDGGEEMASA